MMVCEKSPCCCRAVGTVVTTGAPVLYLSLPAEIEERTILAIVDMRYRNRTAERKTVIVLMESEAGRANVIVDPAVAVHDLVAEIFEQAAVKLVGAALGVHGDDAAGVAAMIGGQHTTLNPKLADAVGRWNRPVDRIELGVLQLVAVHRNAGAIHLASGDGVRVAGVSNEICGVSQRGDVVAYRTLSLDLGNDAGEIERVAVQLWQLGDHFVVEDCRRAGSRKST